MHFKDMSKKMVVFVETMPLMIIMMHYSTEVAKRSITIVSMQFCGKTKTTMHFCQLNFGNGLKIWSVNGLRGQAIEPSEMLVNIH